MSDDGQHVQSPGMPRLPLQNPPADGFGLVAPAGDVMRERQTDVGRQFGGGERSGVRRHRTQY